MPACRSAPARAMPRLLMKLIALILVKKKILYTVILYTVYYLYSETRQCNGEEFACHIYPGISYLLFFCRYQC